MSTWAYTPRSCPRALFSAVAFALLLVFVFSVPAFAASTLVVDRGDPACSDVAGTPYCTIQAAINAAASGDTVLVKNGVYPETLDIFKSLTLEGESQAGVLINASASNDYGIDARDNTNPLSFVFRNFTLDGPNGPAGTTGNYGLKVAGDNVTVTIENVTVISSRRTGIDLNGVNGTLLRNVTSTGSIAGNGIALSDATNVILENITTSNNAWGGLALYAGNDYTPNTANVTLQGTNSLGEPNPIYIEPLGSKVVKALNISGYTHVVQNPAKPSHFFLQPGAAAAAAFAAAFPDPSLSRVTTYAPGVTYAAAAANLQTVIDAAGPGDTLLLSPGLYTQNIVVNKHLKLVGAGAGSDPATNTVLRPASGDVVVITGSGASVSDPLLLKSLRIEPRGTVGVSLGLPGSANWGVVQSMSFVRLEDVQVVGTANQSHIENERCLNVELNKSVAYLAVEGSLFSQCDHGWYFTKHNGLFTPNTVQFVTVHDSKFIDNSYKGVYVEMLSDATFENVVVTGNGLIGNWNGRWNAGIDVNLKGDIAGQTRAYANLVFRNLVMTGNGLGAQDGGALMIKARDDGSSYGARPATLDNVLVEGGIFTGNESGIRFGEPTVNNNGPTNVTVVNAAIYGNNKTYTGAGATASGGLVNQSKAAIMAEYNWWGSASGPTATGNPGGAGERVSNASTGSIDYDPWLGQAPLAALIVPGAPVDLRTGAASFSLPVNLNPAAGSFSSTAFSLDYDTACLSINPADANGDGIPDAISGLPGGFVNSVMLDTADADGELDVAMWDVTPPLASLPAGALLTINFGILPACQGPADHSTYVRFSTDPGVSFSDADGKAVYHTTQGADPLLLDYNQPPTVISLSGGSVAENTPAGAPVGTLTVTDGDGDAPVYTLVSGCSGGDADNGSFTVIGDQVKTTAVFDYEADAAKTICVQADDGQGGVFQQALAINVTPVNEPPTGIALSNNKVAEGAVVGTVVGTFSTSGDPEGATSFTYALVPGDGAADNAKFSISGDQLKTAAAVDFATQSVFYIRVRSTDGGAPAESVEKQFVINVLDHSRLSIADTHVVRHGQQIGIPVLFTANGNTPGSATFGVAYNTACLTYVSTSGGTGSAAGGVVTVNTNGPFTSGALATITFAAVSTCPSGTSVPLTFSAASLDGGALPVDTQNGAVLVISNNARGDCNSDGAVNAGDFSAIVLETFDDDEPGWLNAPQSDFHGSPVGCDANASEYIDVADVVCTVLVVFGNSACTGGTLLAADAAAPASEPALLSVEPALEGATLRIPVTLETKGASVAGAAFTLVYDPAQAVLDESDADGDGLPDAVVFSTPAGLNRSVSVDAANGRIKIAVYGLSLPLPVVADGPIATIQLQTQGDAALSRLALEDAALGNAGGGNTPVEVATGGAGTTPRLYLPVLAN